MQNTQNSVQNRSRSENVFQTIEKGNVAQSQFDLSHDWKGTFTMGQLVPFLNLETLPGDTFTLGNETMLRFAPLYRPLMHRVNVSTWYFYLPNRVIWPGPRGWEEFISDDGLRNVDWPYVNLVADTLINAQKNSLVEYLGFPTPEATHALGWNIDVSCLSVYAYHKIYNDFFRNAWIQDEYWTACEEGQNNTELDAWLPDWNKLQLRNWNPDYYTAGLPTPQAGLSPIEVPMFNASLIDPDLGQDFGGPYQWKTIQGTISTGPISQETNHVFGGAGTKLGGSQNIILDNQQTAATIAQLRLNIKMQEYMEKLNRTGDRYRDTIRGFWSQDPFPGLIDFTELIGSSAAAVQVTDIMSTSYTHIDPAGPDEVLTPLGAYAGKAIAMNGSGRVTYTCQEHGIILALINVQPRTSYFQGLDKKWRRKTKFDYAWPEFANIGDQPVLLEEVVLDYGTFEDGSNNETWDTVFSYIPRFSEYRFHNDVIAGEMRDIVPITAWHMARKFENVIDVGTTVLLNDEFLKCNPKVHENFAVVEDTNDDNINHEIFAHIWNQVTVWRSLPKYGTPGL